MRQAKFLFTLYAVVALGIFVGGLVSPALREQVGPAPLRDAALQLIGRQMLQPEPVIVSVLYSTEKEAWLEETVKQFEAARPTVQGRPIQLTLKKMGSREMYLAVLDGAEKPDLISPASSLQIAILQDLSPAKFGAAIVNRADTVACRPTLNTPLVLVAWRERADVLWGDRPGPDVWKRLRDALVNPQGWSAYNHPEWGYVKFGHTNPLKSNSGFMTILLMTYSYFGKTGGLTSADILSNADYQSWFKELEGTISEFGDSTGTYMRDIVAYGPSKYDIVAVYEAAAIEHIENAAGRYGELRVYYPPATVMSDHPFCVVDTDKIRPGDKDNAIKRQAALKFLDYLTGPEAQKLALLKYGYRPADTTIALDQAGSPFTRYRQNGLSVNLPPQVETPPGNVLNTLLDFWSRAVQK